MEKCTHLVKILDDREPENGYFRVVVYFMDSFTTNGQYCYVKGTKFVRFVSLNDKIHLIKRSTDGVEDTE